MQLTLQPNGNRMAEVNKTNQRDREWGTGLDWSEEGGEAVKDVRGGVVGGLPVEVSFGVGAAGAELESVMWSAFAEALDDHCWGGFQDHR